MDDYDTINKSSLRFKGEKRKKKKSKNPDKQHKGSSFADGNELSESQADQNARADDAELHGGWWKVDQYKQIHDDVAIEFLPGCYAKALSNGIIALGQPHPPGEGPDEEEIFTAISASTNQIALKSGFGKYLGVNNRKHLMGISDAIGESELFTPVFEDEKLALSAFNDCFLSPGEESETQPIVAQSETAGPYEMVNIRINYDPVKYSKQNQDSATTSESIRLYESDLQYVKKYGNRNDAQSSIEEDRKLFKKAHTEGQLHEILLDKRVKRKSDKYCK